MVFSDRMRNIQNVNGRKRVKPISYNEAYIPWTMYTDAVHPNHSRNNIISTRWEST